MIIPGCEHLSYDGPLTFEETMRDLRIDMDAIKTIPAYTISNESFSGFFKNMLTSIVNVIMHVINLFKTNVFKSFIQLKRTELRYYIESNVATMKRIRNSSFTDVSDIVIPYPVGMSCRYLDGIITVTKTLVACDVVTKSKIAVNKTESILKALSAGTISDTVISESITVLDPSNLRELGEQSASVINTSAKVNSDKTFGELFLSMQDMLKCEEALLSAERLVQDIALAHKNMATCHDNFVKIIKQVENGIGTTVQKSDVEKLATLAYYIAETFDIFASTVNVYHVLEHNLVEVYKVLRSRLF